MPSMEVSMRQCLSVLLMCVLGVSATSFRLAASAPFCRRDFKAFLLDLNSQCPFSKPLSSPPIQVDGESFEKAMSSSQKNEYTVVLFYASWCPFSSVFHSKFSTLSSMYPQIKHLMVEQSSAKPRWVFLMYVSPHHHHKHMHIFGRFITPLLHSSLYFLLKSNLRDESSVFSRYGIHSVPSILMVNQTTRMRYYGQKDLQSLVNFYKRTTGLDPVVDMVEETSSNSDSGHKVFKPWNGGSLRETFLGEPYLVLSAVFVLLRAFLYFFPEIVSRLMALWVAYIPHLNLGIFGESRQLLGHVLHLIDVKRIWSKLKICKTRNFHEGARNARVWASSLASVSLGETSSSRVFPSRDL